VGNFEKSRIDTTFRTVQADFRNIDTSLTTTKNDTRNTANMFGATAGDTIVFYPPNGTAPKDSGAVFNNGWKKSWDFHHKNVNTVIDTVFVH